MDLLDARGYEVRIDAGGDRKVRLGYLGPEIPDHPEQLYDEDQYVKSHIKDETFTGTFETALKDSGIRKSGLRVRLEVHGGDPLKITVCGDLSFDLSPREGVVDELLDVSGVLSDEKQYLSKVRSILYSILKETDRICTKYDIPYFLVQGGLIGAWRYDEMIPWDDDADVAMTRADYIRFREAAAREMGKDYTVVDCSEIGDNVFLDYLCRIVYLGERVPCNIFRKAGDLCRKEVSEGISVDIFIFDNASDNKRQHKFQMFLMRVVYGLSMGHRAYIDQEEYKIRDFKTRAAIRILPSVGKLFKAKTLFSLHDKVSSMYNKKDTRDWFMSNGWLPFIHTRYEKKWFSESKRIPFGPITVNAPLQTEAYLKRAYYDYYHYVPMSKRKSQHSADDDGVFT